MRSPDLQWTMGRMTLKCIYTFAVTFSKMEKLVKFLILQLVLQYVPYVQNQLTNCRPTSDEV